MKKITKYDYHRFCVAPMLNYTDSQCRFFYRQMTKKSLLYTEMITTNSILNNDYQKLIYNFPIENPIAIQLAGRIPSDLAKCSKIAYNLGYNEINLNIGCPSEKIQNAKYGIYLMKETSVVIKCIQAIYNAVPIPISIKTRTGLDHQNSYDFISHFIEKISNSQYCKIFIIHARQAWSLGVNPKKNRNLPPLKYSFVYQLKKDFPSLKIIINGGIQSIKEAKMHLSHVDGVMLGRAIYKNPSILTQVDENIFNHKKNNYNIIQTIQNILPYIDKKIKNGTLRNNFFRHISGAFYEHPGSKIWKNTLNGLKKEKKATKIIEKTLHLILNL